MDYDCLAGLNEEQRQAVTATEGYVRVIAGAGSGKTRALTRRYAYLVNELGISASGILCATFTNKAAYEMKRRIRAMIGDQDTGFICTFHGFCVQVLREDIHAMNYPSGFLVLDSEDTDAMLRDIYQDAKIDSKRCTFTMARDMISGRKDKLEHIPYVLSLDNSELVEKYKNSTEPKDRIFYGYLYQQKKCFGLDYDDLITFVFHILTHFPEKCQKWQERLEYIMVDEFQDVSAMQYGLADILSGYHKNLFAVGDPDQTIYTWRGASVDFILNFDKTHPDTTTIVMDRNYRSTQDILNASNSLIKKNQKRIDKDLQAFRGSNAPVLYHHAKTAQEEALWISNQLLALHEGGERFSDSTILYRSHYASRSLEEAFLQKNIPYVLYSGVEFYRRKEIKDMLSYLRMVAYADDLSFLRIINEPRRNMGTKRMNLLKEYANTHGCTLYQALLDNLEQPLIQKSGAGEFIELTERYRTCFHEMRVSDLLDALLSSSGYEAMLRTGGENERLDNIAELKQAVLEFEHSAGEETFLEDYLQSAALFTNADKEEKPDCVKMMTIHTAKGLEFPNVFLTSFSEGIFPTKHVSSIDSLEEERRLAYVAYTRAMNHLFLSDSEGVNFDGSFRYPSRFLFDTGKEYVTYTAELPSQLAGEAAAYIQMSENRIRGASQTTFTQGDRVRHKVFGDGEILEVNADDNSYTIKFDTAKTSRTINMRIPLEKAPQN